MKLVDLRAMRGPNFWSVRYQNLIVMKLDLEDLEHRPTNTIAGFSERIQHLIPSLYNHFCSEGHPGGFFERVKDGTWMGHVIEHIALEIQALAGMDCGFGRTRSTGQEGVYNVVFAYEEETAGLFAAVAAVRIAEALINSQPYDLQADIDALKQIKKEQFPGPSTSAILEEARRRNIPVLSISPNGLYQLGYGKRQRRIRASMADTTGCIAVDIAGDKDETKYLLAEAGIPVPRGTIITHEQELEKAVADIGFPVVLKPLDGHQGKGITVGIRTLEEAQEALKMAQEVSDQVIVEQCIGGLDFRLLVINYKFVAASRRTAAAITGDGQSTVQQLINHLNSDPKRGGGHESFLTCIKIDSITEGILEHKGLTLDSVLPQGEVLYLKKTANLSTGGTATDVTGQMHPFNIRLAERIARTIGLDICGIDLAAPTIETPIISNRGAVLEVNAAPGLRMHLAPAEGQARNVAAPILDMLFPAGIPARIPIVAVTGTNGKTTVTRLLAHIVQSAGYHTGFTTTDGIYINGELIQQGDNTGPVSTRVILKDPEVEFAVLECARGGLLRSGLGFDQCDVGIVTNVAADHLGLGDIHTVEQMAKVKAVIPESVHENGYAVLNAEDDLVYEMHTRVKSKVAYFSLDAANPRILEHTTRGGLAAVLKVGAIVLMDGHGESTVAQVADIPITFSGTALYMVQNVLAAVLGATTQGITIERIRQALSTFIPSAVTIPGRMNIFEFNRFQFIIDYAHNPAGLQAVGEFISKLPATPKVGIIAGVGDRRSEDIQEMGRLAAAIFDEIIIRLDKDLRDRAADEIVNLLKSGIAQENASRPVTIIPDEKDAMAYAIQQAKEGSVVVHFSEKVMDSIAYISQLQAAHTHTNGRPEVIPSQAAVQAHTTNGQSLPAVQ